MPASAAAAAVLLPLLAASAAASAAAAGGARTYLTLDDRNVIASANLELVLGAVTKHPANPLVTEDKAWEQRFDNLQPSVWVDPVDNKWKLWYNTFATCSPMDLPICQAGADDDGTRPKKAGQGGPVPCNGTNELMAPMPTRTGALCYAESVDGVAWSKPGLGLVAFTDSAGKVHPAAETNIVLGTGLGHPGATPGAHGGAYPTGNGVTLDERVGEARFKMLGTQAWGEGYVATSEDGLRWGNMTMMPAGRWDSHLNVQLDPGSGKWVAYARATPTTTFGGYAGGAQTVRIQAVGESEGADFLGRWGTDVPAGLNASEWYQPDALVSFAYEGVFLGFANVISFNTTTPGQHEQGGGDNPGGTVTSELVFSADAKHWRYLKPGQSFVPRGVPGKDFDCCGIFTAKQGYQPSQQPDAAANSTLRVYYGGCNGPFLGSRACALGLARVQKHGWAGLRAHTSTPGRFTAAPVHVPADPSPPYNPKACAHPLPGVNCMGDDIRGVGSVASAQACCRRCAALAGCGAWSWNRGYSPQSCWLKRGCPSRTNDSNVDSGVVAVKPGNRTVLLTADVPAAAAAAASAAAAGGAAGVRVGVVGDPLRTLANCVPLRGKLTEAPVYWVQGSTRTGLEDYMGGAVQLEFLVPPGATVFAFTV